MSAWLLLGLGTFASLIFTLWCVGRLIVGSTLICGDSPMSLSIEKPTFLVLVYEGFLAAGMVLLWLAINATLWLAYFLLWS